MLKKFLTCCIWIISSGFCGENSTIKEVFIEEYLNPINLRTCPNDELLCQLNQLKENFGIQKIIDVGCGDASWISPMFKFCDYTGIDVVDEITNKNKQEFNNGNFLTCDITLENLPTGDLILCRNCLESLSYFDIISALKQFKVSGSTYLLVSTDPTLDVNKETSTGIRRTINLQADPFFFPKPILLLNDESEKGESLALWCLNDVDLSCITSCTFPPVTILTKPVGKPFKWEHAGVVMSARRGLDLLHCNYNYNPETLNEVKENVVVIADVEAAREALEWKRNKKIKTLLVGPNIVPSHANFFSWPLLDVYLSPSEWPTITLKRQNPSLKSRVWFVGVDEKYWKPSQKFHEKNSNYVLLYRKTNYDVCDNAKICLEKNGYHVLEIAYGSYNHENYKAALQICKFAVFVSISESQGIALAEAWSMDVPTLIWNPKQNVHYDGCVYTDATSSPYLNSMVGNDWVTINELQGLLDTFNENAFQFQPRRWVLTHMTDKISIEQLFALIREAKE